VHVEFHRRNGISKETASKSKDEQKWQGNLWRKNLVGGGFEDTGSNIVLSPEEDLGLNETPHISG